jgi:hypothetical protein
MKTQRPPRRTRVIREKKERVKPNCEQAIRLCEQAAARIKAASDELAACWMALARELSTTTSATGLLRKRAWCNVLELRLKERAHALEEARLGVDAVWQEIMQAVRSRELLNRLLRKNNNELSAAHQVWPLLVQSVTAPQPVNPAKKS